VKRIVKLLVFYCFSYSEEGMETLFAGITPKLIRALIGGALQFATLELVKSETIKALK